MALPDAYRQWEDLTVRTVRYDETLPWLKSGEKWTEAHLNAFYSCYRRPLHSYVCQNFPRYQREAEEVFNNLALFFYTHPEKTRCASMASFHAIVNQTFKRRLQDKVRAVDRLKLNLARLQKGLKGLFARRSRDPAAERRFALRLMDVCANFRDGVGLEDAYQHGIDDDDRQLWCEVRIEKRPETELAARLNKTNKAISAAVCKVSDYLQYSARLPVV